MALAAPAASAAATAAVSQQQLLGIREISIAASLITIVGGLGLSRLGLIKLCQQLMISCARCTIQLQLLGGLILQFLFTRSSHSFWLVSGWIIGVGMIAAQESYNRINEQYKFPGLRRQLTFSILVGTLLVLSFAVIFQLFGGGRGRLLMQPSTWHKHPQTIVPVVGMLFGNTLTATTLVTSSLTKGFVTEQNQIEFWLRHGATYHEACRQSVTKSSLEIALLPTINALSTTGIVHLPGMMTGQILAGQSPKQAGLYQTLIWFLIVSVASITTQLVNAFLIRTFMDTKQHRIIPIEDLRRRQKTETTTRTTTPRHPHRGHDLKGGEEEGKEGNDDQLTQNKSSTPATTMTTTTTPPNSGSNHCINNKVTMVPLSSSSSSSSPSSTIQQPTTFRVENLHVERCCATTTNNNGIVLSLELQSGDRVGITGPSGIGKSQLLRTLVGLEKVSIRRRRGRSHGYDDDIVTTMEVQGSSFSLLDATTTEDDERTSSSSLPAPEWRTRVCFVSQDLPTSGGGEISTPREFYEKIQKFHYQKERRRRAAIHNKISSRNTGRKENANNNNNESPMDLASRELDLSIDVWDRSWSTLSGGEAQRVSLAIALSLEPAVLLLDEPSSALDEANTVRLEKSLQQRNVPIILVTHDRSQLERFCTHHIDLALYSSAEEDTDEAQQKR